MRQLSRENAQVTRTNSKETGKYRISETATIAMLLAVVGGFLDAYTYLFRGKVFANGQTGNLVLLGISLTEGNFRNALYYVLPIAAFVIGIFFAESIHSRIGNERFIKWRHVILILEIALLLAAVFVPQGGPDPLVNICVSFICALQTQSFRSLRGKPYISVMCTGNLRSGAQEICNYQKTKDRKHRNHGLQYFLVVGFFIIGAVLGALCIGYLHQFSLFIPIALLLLVFLLLLMNDKMMVICERLGLSWLNK